MQGSVLIQRSETELIPVSCSMIFKTVLSHLLGETPLVSKHSLLQITAWEPLLWSKLEVSGAR